MKTYKFPQSVVALMFLFLTGCSASHSDLDEQSLSRQNKHNTETAQTTEENVRPSFVPSQLDYSLSLLNEQQDTTDYPAVAVLAEKDPALLTPEERKRLEEELIKLNGRAKSD